MKIKELYYEIAMGFLAILSVMVFWFDNSTWLFIDRVIWLIFVVDVLIRLFKSENKLRYLKEHPFDLIAIIPFDSIFRLARFARLFRIIRLLAVLDRLSFFKIIKTNKLDKVILFTILIVIISAIPIKMIEPNINTYEDGLWWAVVTATTVGYGDISPETGIGRVIALLLMLFGIGLLGMITGSIATFFLGGEKKESTAVTFIKKELSRIDELTKEDIDTIILILERMKVEKQIETDPDKLKKD